MATSTVQIRMDSELKKDVEQVFRDMGLNMTSAITMFCRQVLNQGKIPFEIRLSKNGYSASTIRSMDDTLAGKNLSREFTSVDEMWENLNA
ncbi:MAG: type II toxin-antitoxin system RelB/DinJ family antitoxin [Anaerovibrio sp.]